MQLQNCNAGRGCLAMTPNLEAPFSYMPACFLPCRLQLPMQPCTSCDASFSLGKWNLGSQHSAPCLLSFLKRHVMLPHTLCKHCAGITLVPNVSGCRPPGLAPALALQSLHYLLTEQLTGCRPHTAACHLSPASYLCILQQSQAMRCPGQATCPNSRMHCSL